MKFSEYQNLSEDEQQEYGKLLTEVKKVKLDELPSDIQKTLQRIGWNGKRVTAELNDIPFGAKDDDNKRYIIGNLAAFLDPNKLKELIKNKRFTGVSGSFDKEITEIVFKFKS